MKIRNLSSLSERMLEIARNNFNKDFLPEPFEEFTTSILYYHDLHQITKSEEVLDKIKNVVMSGIEDSKNTVELCKIHSEIVGLRVMKEIVDSKQEDIIQKVAHRFFLDEKQLHRLFKLTDLYRIINNKNNWESLDFISMDEKSKLECIQGDLIISYYRHLINKNMWNQYSNSIESILFPVDRIEKQIDMIPTPQNLMSVFFDEKHYEKVWKDAKSKGEVLLANLAQGFLVPIKLMKNKNYVQNNYSKIENTLKELDNVTASSLKSIQPFVKNLFFYFRGLLHMIISLTTKTTNQKKHLDLAISDMFEASELQFRLIALNLVWLKSKLESPLKQIELQSQAFEMVDEALSDCILIDEAGPRMFLLASFMLIPPAWKHDMGDFESALEYSLRAKTFTQKAMNVVEEDLNNTLQEMSKDLASDEFDEDEKSKIRQLRNTLIASIEGAKILEDCSEILILTNRAKIAENQGQYEISADYYEQASDYDKKAQDRIKDIFKLFFDGTGFELPRPQNNQLFTLEARSQYFLGMSYLNKADKFLINGAFGKASQNYLKAKDQFLSSLDIWKELSSTKEKEKTNVQPSLDANNWIDITMGKLKFTDIKLLVCDAERFIDIGEHKKASEEFFKAHMKYRELLITTNISGGSRNTDILLGCKNYCHARSILENKFPNISKEDLNIGSEYLYNSSISFGKAKEVMWQNSINALRFEYEGFFYQKIANEYEGPERKSCLEMSRSKYMEAIKLYELNEAETKADKLRMWIDQSIQKTAYSFDVFFVLPNPQDTLSVTGKVIEEQVGSVLANNPKLIERKESNQMDQRIKELLSVAKSITSYLEELDERRGIQITEEQYQANFIRLDSKKNSLLLGLKEIIGGKDPNYDSIIQMELDGNDKEAVQKELVDLATKNNWGKKFIESIKNNKDKILNLIIEAGLKIADKSII